MGIGLIIDIIIVAIVALSTFIGYKVGLTKSLLKIFSFVIAVIVAVVLFKPVSAIVIDNTQIDENIQNSIVSMFENHEKEEENKEEDKQDNMPAVFYEYIEKTVKDATNDAKDQIVKDASRQIAISIINVGVIIALFIAASIIVLVIGLLTNTVSKLPVIKECNEIGGAVFGFLRACVIILVVFTIITLLAPSIEGLGIMDMIRTSIIGNFLYNNNLLFNIIF